MSIVAAHERGEIPRTVIWGACPTQFDPSQAPAGAHTAFMSEKLPYALNGDSKNWDAQKDAHGREMLALWQQHAPICARPCSTPSPAAPLDTERLLPNMMRGECIVGSFATIKSATTAPSKAQAPTPQRNPRPLPLRRLHPPRRQRHRPMRLQCRQSGAGGLWRPLRL